MIHHLQDIAEGRFPPDTQQWLTAAINQTIADGDPTSLARHLGLTRFRQGWITALRRQQWEEHIAKCYEILGTTQWGAAELIAKEMERQSRSRRPPDSEFSRLAKEAMDIHPAGTRTDTGLYHALSRILR